MLEQKMKKTFFRKERIEKEVLITENKTVSKKKKSLKDKGITLIALVVTIIILLILAGITIGAITGNNGLFQRASESREASRGGEVREYVSLTIGDNEIAKLMNKPITDKEAAVQELLSKGKLTPEEATQLETTDVITIGGIEIDFSGLNEYQGLTLGKVYTDDMIGLKFEYSSNGQNEWIIFGKDEDGNILITTKEPINANYEVPCTVESWLDYEDNLNKICSAYGGTIQGKKVTSRSITIKDINYVSGYTEPEYDTYTFGTEYDYENKKVDYLYPKKGSTAISKDYEYDDEKGEWVEAGEYEVENWMKATNASEAQTFKNNRYYYEYKNGMGGEYTDGWSVILNGYTHIKTSLYLDKLKFIWGDESNKYNYAVASRSVGVGSSGANFNMVGVYNLGVNAYGRNLCRSSSDDAGDNGGSSSWGIRPVVVIPASIKVDEPTLGSVYSDEMIGQKLTYSSNGQDEWIVFGKDESGNVLITTKEPINANYEVQRTVESWIDYEDNLNAACGVYGATIQGKTVTSRSITLKDINYVSGYKEPEFDTYTFGTEKDLENRKVDYLYPKKGATTTIGEDTYTNWMKATNASETETFKNNGYYYQYKTGWPNEGYTDGWGVILNNSTNIKASLNSDKLKFIWGDESNQYKYAVASSSVAQFADHRISI